MASTASLLTPDPEEISNHDEISIQQRLLLSHSLKDLKFLRSQLYSAAEYFERSYTNDNQKQIVEDALKDYAIKAIVNTVDHLGSATYNVNDLLRGKVDEVSGTELKVSCIEQRLRTCQQYIDQLGISQQTLIINSSKYHKRYALPVGEAMPEAIPAQSNYHQGCRLNDEDNCYNFGNETGARILHRFHHDFQKTATFSFTDNTPRKELEKRTLSPHQFPTLRSLSLSRPNTPISSIRTTPSSSSVARWYTSGSPKPVSTCLHKRQPDGIEQYPIKSNGLKVLFTRRKSKKNGTRNAYLD